MNPDEANFVNIAYCLLTTGRDLYGNFLPLVSHGRHFITYLPVQIYLHVAPVAAFGFTEFAVRFMPALIGVLIVLLSFLIGRLLFNDFVGLLTAFLVSVAPWHVTYSRIGFPNILPTTFFFLLGLYLLLKGLLHDRRLMLLGAAALGLTFFSYYIADVYVPLFLFGLYYILYERLKSARKVGFYYLSLVVVGLLLFASIAIGYNEGTFMNRPAQSVGELWSNLVEEVGVILLFRGWWASPSFPDGVGIIYHVYVPFLLLGVILLLLRRDYVGFLAVYWFLLALVVGALSSSVGGGSLRRIFTIAGPVFELIVAYSVYRVFVFYRRSGRTLVLLALVASTCLFLDFGSFAFYYFVRQPHSVEAERLFELPLKELFGYTESVKEGYGKIVFDDELKSRVCVSNDSNGQKVYVVCKLGFEDYLMFYTKRCPTDPKYVFGNLSSYPLGGGNLFVTQRNLTTNNTPVKTVRYSDGDVAYMLFA